MFLECSWKIVIENVLNGKTLVENILNIGNTLNRQLVQEMVAHGNHEAANMLMQKKLMVDQQMKHPFAASARTVTQVPAAVATEVEEATTVYEDYKGYVATENPDDEAHEIPDDDERALSLNGEVREVDPMDALDNATTFAEPVPGRDFPLEYPWEEAPTDIDATIFNDDGDDETVVPVDNETVWEADTAADGSLGSFVGMVQDGIHFPIGGKRRRTS